MGTGRTSPPRHKAGDGSESGPFVFHGFPRIFFSADFSINRFFCTVYARMIRTSVGKKAGTVMSCFGHGADVFCHSPSAMIQSRQVRQRNQRVLQKKTRERKKMPTECCVYLYALRKGGHTFPFNDRPRLKAWIVAVHRGEAVGC